MYNVHDYTCIHMGNCLLSRTSEIIKLLNSVSDYYMWSGYTTKISESTPLCQANFSPNFMIMNFYESTTKTYGLHFCVAAGSVFLNNNENTTQAYHVRLTTDGKVVFSANIENTFFAGEIIIVKL